MLQKIIGALLIIAVIVGVVLLIKNSPKATKYITQLVTASTPTPGQSTVSINGHTFNVEIARTEAAKELGLANRDPMATDHGMLFPFSTPGDYGFWMKDMRFPLDIIYFRQNKVVTVISNAQPPQSGQTTLPIYHPSAQADIVLEINGGLAQKYNIKLGDSATINQ